MNGRLCTFEEKEGLHFQMFDPATASITKLARTTVSRGLVWTATLLPDGLSILSLERNREALVRPDDPSFPLMSSYAGLLPSAIQIRRSSRTAVLSTLTYSSRMAAELLDFILKSPEEISTAAFRYRSSWQYRSDFVGGTASE